MRQRSSFNQRLRSNRQFKWPERHMGANLGMQLTDLDVFPRFPPCPLKRIFEEGERRGARLSANRSITTVGGEERPVQAGIEGNGSRTTR